MNTSIMSNAERVRALLNRRKPDRVPIFPQAHGSFSAAHVRLSAAEAYNEPETSISAQRKAAADFDWAVFPLVGYASFGGWEFGGDIKWPSGEHAQAPMLTRHAVQKPEDAAKLELPDIRDAGIVPYLLRALRFAVQNPTDNEVFRSAFALSGTFNTAANIAGMANFSRWLIKAPEAAHRLLRLATEFLVGLAALVKEEFGAESILPWGGEPSTSNQVISPKMFETYALPYLKETHERIVGLGFRHIFKHICGEQNRNLPFWSKVPMGDPGLVSFGPEVDLRDAAKYFPNDIVIGNLDPVLILTGSADEVYEASRRIILPGKELPCGFMFGPGCDLPPAAPAENVRAMTRAVEEFGWY